MNLDNAHDEVIRLHRMTREQFEDKMLGDPQTFENYTLKFMRSSTGPSIRSLLDWSWQRYVRECDLADNPELAKKPREYNFMDKGGNQ